MTSMQGATGLDAGGGANPRDPQALVAALAPQLIESAGGKLHDLHWFRADWQRGGAATAFARIDVGNGSRDVVVKVPVGHTELMWMQRLSSTEDDGVLPRVYACGEELGGFLLAWIVIERFRHGPLGARWDPAHVPRIADAAARFEKAAAGHPVDVCSVREDWTQLVAEARQRVKLNEVHDWQHWSKVLKALQARLDDLVIEWRSRPTRDWLHGDLQPANCMCRSDDDAAPVALIDLAEVRAGHWVEDAVYLERLFWARPERLGDYDTVREFARARRNHGLRVDDGYLRLGMIRRALLAATAPRFMKTEGHPAHLAACLARLEEALAAL